MATAMDGDRGVSYSVKEVSRAISHGLYSTRGVMEDRMTARATQGENKRKRQNEADELDTFCRGMRCIHPPPPSILDPPRVARGGMNKFCTRAIVACD
jgi:hypothetical protein